MSRGLNKVMIIGHLGRDPEMRYTPTGRPVTTFSVATNRSWNKSDGERHSETEWFNVVAWGDWQKFVNNISTKVNRFMLKEDFNLANGKTAMASTIHQLRLLPMK